MPRRAPWLPEGSPVRAGFAPSSQGAQDLRGITWDGLAQSPDAGMPWNGDCLGGWTQDSEPSRDRSK